MKTIDLSGLWQFQFDPNKVGVTYPFQEAIQLPGTTSFSGIGEENLAMETYFLTDAYKYEGLAWYEKTIILADLPTDTDCYLFLERTRMTQVWVNDHFIGSGNSLTTPHIYPIPVEFLKKDTITIRIGVDNTGYPTPGGHMTSQDTQSNWNGITGKIELQWREKKRIDHLFIKTHVEDKSITLTGQLMGAQCGEICVGASSLDGSKSFPVRDYFITNKDVSLRYELGKGAQLWSEFNPMLYEIVVEVKGGERQSIIIGLRSFQAALDKFEINGVRTFLRGKHDGLIFPDTGFAPTDLEKWLEVLSIAKSYGINHYRFHTCVPPEAAFCAADRLGIYMQPELPFWGTITKEGDLNHDPKQQDYLVKEGFEILKTFGHHPSFVMMSLGNELWGSKEVLSGILAGYKAFDDRHLYTQGSNNFQFVPNVLPEDDFFSGVRLRKDKLIRGSYAMCDAPLGHIQTQSPSTRVDYDNCFVITDKHDVETNGHTEMIDIQFGTSTKRVEATDEGENFCPAIPVVTHEIGQYQTYPDFNEIKRYTGPLKARNFQVFQERLESKGLGDLAHDYFMNSGKFAMSLYQEEIEAALRSHRLAGFQLLDLQDFSGQGTALVGVLNAFMESKGLISEKEWRGFCNDAVILARFDSYQYEGESIFETDIQLFYYRNKPMNQVTLYWKMIAGDGTLRNTDELFSQGTLTFEINTNQLMTIGHLSIRLPQVTKMMPASLVMWIPDLDLEKVYEIILYPKTDGQASENKRDILEIEKGCTHFETDEWTTAKGLLERGESVLYFPKREGQKSTSTMDGFYCTDFWCYPMFRSISESVNKPIPVGTMGLLIQDKHLALQGFYTKSYSTPQWYAIVSASYGLIIDDTPSDFRPIIQTIDNFERNHKIAMLFECQTYNGKLMVCTCDKNRLDTLEGKAFLKSIRNYVSSEAFLPSQRLEEHVIVQLFKANGTN